ncbi:MAG TPA: Tim44/TimA family putative adaptor protein [Alphaproteobacteria bacterium]|nr:Tim44/TimA family putative adaptor protein [Alphaproteobacteria bacterium]
MDSGFAFFDIVFFAMVAAFLILRLRSVLGRRTGNENPERWTARKPTAPARGDTTDNVARLPERPRPVGDAAPTLDLPANSPVQAGLTQIQVADPNFDPQSFVEGARGAFEMIVGAYAQGDTATLRPLLADDVYENFAAAIRSRQQAKQTHETTLVGIKSADIVEARMDGRTALVTVKFVTEQINVTRDAAGTVVEGDPQHIATVTDVWTFSRNTRSRDPNWLLVATADQA